MSDGEMSYLEMRQMLLDLLSAGGFPPDEPLDSTARIGEASNGEPLKTYQIGSYASALASVGEWARAEAVARSIKDDEDEKGLALASIAQKLAAAGFLERAREIATAIRTDTLRSGAVVEKVVALSSIASGLASIGQNEPAAEVLKEAELAITQPDNLGYSQADCFLEMAEIWLRLGEKPKALSLWDQAAAVAQAGVAIHRSGGTTDVDSLKILRYIVLALVNVKEAPKARELAASIDIEPFRERLIQMIDEAEK